MSSIADHPPTQVPTAPNEIVHIAEWHRVPEDQSVVDDEGDEPITYAEFLDRVDWVQQQQMQEIRALGVREGQSDETITAFRQHVLKLRDLTPNSGSEVDQLIRDTYRQDLLQIGAAGRLLAVEHRRRTAFRRPGSLAGRETS